MKILEINEVKSTVEITNKILQLDLLQSGKKQGTRKYIILLLWNNAMQCMYVRLMD